MKKRIWLAAILMMSCLLIGKTEAEAKSTTTVNLKEGKTYSYNLDKKGKSEKIQKVAVKESDGKSTTASLYINKKKVLTVPKSARVYVGDTDRSDKQMEIFVVKAKNNYFDSWAGDLKSILYYRYKSGKLKKVQNVTNVFKSKYSKMKFLHPRNEKKLFTVDGKGKLSAKVCLHLSEPLDYVHFVDYVQLKKGKFVKSTKKTFQLVDEEGEVSGMSKGVNKVYKKAGSSKVAYRLKNKEMFYKKQVYIKDKKNYYLKIKNEKGKTGYIKTSEFKGIQIVGFHI